MITDESQCCLEGKQVPMKIADDPKGSVAGAGNVDDLIMVKTAVCVEQHWPRPIEEAFHALDGTPNPRPDTAAADEFPKGSPIQIFDFDDGGKGARRPLSIRFCYRRAGRRQHGGRSTGLVGI